MAPANRERGRGERGDEAEVVLGRDNRLSLERLRNAFVAGLVEYLAEDDIVRFEDDFGRE